MKESKIEKTVCDYAESKGWDQFKWVSPGCKGVNDRLFFKKKKLKIVEFKREGEEPKPIQIYIHKRLKKQGFKVHVIDNIEEGKRLFD